MYIIIAGCSKVGANLVNKLSEEGHNVGRYRTVGDTVQLTGTFHRDCAEHGGDMDIHADTILIMERGQAIVDHPSAGLLVAAGALSLCALAGAILLMKKKSML